MVPGFRRAPPWEVPSLTWDFKSPMRMGTSCSSLPYCSLSSSRSFSSRSWLHGRKTIKVKVSSKQTNRSILARAAHLPLAPPAPRNRPLDSSFIVPSQVLRHQPASEASGTCKVVRIVRWAAVLAAAAGGSGAWAAHYNALANSLRSLQLGV